MSGSVKNLCHRLIAFVCLTIDKTQSPINSCTIKRNLLQKPPNQEAFIRINTFSKCWDERKNYLEKQRLCSSFPISLSTLQFAWQMWKYNHSKKKPLGLLLTTINKDVMMSQVPQSTINQCICQPKQNSLISPAVITKWANTLG